MPKIIFIIGANATGKIYFIKQYFTKKKREEIMRKKEENFMCRLIFDSEFGQ